MENFKDLEEIEIKNAVEPQVFKYKCDDKIEDIPYPLPDTIFRMACIGRSGSGTTNLIKDLTNLTGKIDINYRVIDFINR